MRRAGRNVVAVRNAQSTHPVDVRSLREAVRATLRKEGVKEPVEVSVLLVDDPAIRALNRTYLSRDEPTDVLAFPQPGPHGSRRVLGDVVISVDRAAAQAREAGWSLEEELVLLTVHGTLHLLGYEDQTPSARARMWERQEAILRALRVREQPRASPLP
ncbi:MAG: rRNA maturation RNase YbeY [Armatimonadetes bacterium]|nr:rRNA maturation RNase YbeY [Armatimonadota bacterium]MDW8154194.1 rRNA maturation RNase YbeY [Armatimonadota bacterium]